MSKSMAWIQLFSGKKFCPLNPNIDDIDIIDIAHSLSMQCRFTGHSRFFYSVAQHSVYVSQNCNPEDALYGLLHDGSEYVLTDIPSPLKRSGEFETYKMYEGILQRLIYSKFGLSEMEPESVKIADTRILATEARDLMSPLHPDWYQPAEPYAFTINPLPPEQAEKQFLEAFELLRKI